MVKIIFTTAVILLFSCSSGISLNEHISTCHLKFQITDKKSDYYYIIFENLNKKESEYIITSEKTEIINYDLKYGKYNIHIYYFNKKTETTYKITKYYYLKDEIININDKNINVLFTDFTPIVSLIKTGDEVKLKINLLNNDIYYLTSLSLKQGIDKNKSIDYELFNNEYTANIKINQYGLWLCNIGTNIKSKYINNDILKDIKLSTNLFENINLGNIEK